MPTIKNILTIGADPELCINSPIDHRPVSGESMLSVSNPTGANTEFGLDGNPSTLELRPKPQTDPILLAEYIYKILEQAKIDHPQIFRMELRASDMQRSIGGHIHFGHTKIKPPTLGTSIFSDTSDGLARRALSQNLDLLLSVPVSFLENPDHRNRRVVGGSYGKLSDTRLAEYGIEYRTLPSWLSSRKFAEGVLSLGWVIAKYTLTQDDSPILSPLWNGLKSEDVTNAWKQNAITIFKPYLPIINKEIKKMADYESYKKPIDYLMECSRSGRVLQNLDIKIGWGIKFVRIADMKLESLGQLIEKIGRAITVAVAGEDMGNMAIVEWGEQFRTQDIATNIESSLISIITPEILRGYSTVCTG